ncbi:MAG TPA: glycine cleavage system aminomethyltransferase GcvT [Candidatus Limnocylindrales bacterium]|nr:glycine cleavage system aminomethyltransferase GcvT [Candidatus Limnocylindrales bacterium]
MTDVAAPLRTSLHETHRSLGARLIEFGGWEMPVQYSGIIEEHRAVRERAGLFDLSHMGELWLTGPQAGDALAYALVTDPPRLKPGRAHYAMLCAPDGGILDDLIVYRLAEQRFLVVPNAANRETVADALRERIAAFEAELDDASLRTALIALQGPRAAVVLGPLTDVDLDALRYYSIAEGSAAGAQAHIARTGYTGEDGFELFVAWQEAPAVWQRLLDAGREAGVVPVGLGARDTLRLEAGMPLYGNELDRETNPLEAGLGRVVKFDKPADFVGRAALERVAAEGPRKTLVGLVLRERGIGRHGYPVHRRGEADACGVVTSGTASPTLGVPIAMAYVPPDQGEPGTMVEVGIRAARAAAEVVPMPFYTRPS